MIKYLIINTLSGILFSSEPSPKHYIRTSRLPKRSLSDSEIMPFRRLPYRESLHYALHLRTRWWERFVTVPFGKPEDHKDLESKEK